MFVSELCVFVDGLSCECGVGVWFECGKGGNGGDEHSHGMGVVSEGFHLAGDVGVEEGVAHYSEWGQGYFCSKEWSWFLEGSSP